MFGAEGNSEVTPPVAGLIALRHTGPSGSDLRNAVGSLTGMDQTTLDNFMNSALVTNLVAHSSPSDLVGLQYSGPQHFSVPEPSSLLLLAAGGGSVLLAVRRSLRRDKAGPRDLPHSPTLLETTT